MAMSKLFKKESAPEELPDLAIDELKKDLKKDFSDKEEPKIEDKKEEVKKPKEEVKIEEAPKEDGEVKEEVKEDSPEKEEPKIEDKKEEVKKIKVEKKEEVNENKNPLEKSFFNPLLTELKKENFDPSKIDGWYQRTFSDKSAIEWMKEYWEKQKDEFITESIEKEFKSRISEKMIALQKLEAEWQEIYINLIKKEEEMKKEEMNIKKVIKEFSEVLKKKGNVKKEQQIK